MVAELSFYTWTTKNNMPPNGNFCMRRCSNGVQIRGIPLKHLDSGVTSTFFVAVHTVWKWYSRNEASKDGSGRNKGGGA